MNIEHFIQNLKRNTLTVEEKNAIWITILRHMNAKGFLGVYVFPAGSEVLSYVGGMVRKFQRIVLGTH